MWIMFSVLRVVSPRDGLTGGGGAGTGPFTPTPPPPPPCWVLARKCRTMGTEGALRKFCLLDLVDGEKMGFHPMCLYSKYSVFLGELNSG